MRNGLWAVLLALGIAALAAPVPAHAQGPHSIAEQYLFQAANAERYARGLPALQWDETLYRAARQHAFEMASRESIAHQYEGEADLSERAGRAGSRFSEVAENVAEAPTATLIHRGWMESEHHRENLLDSRLNRVAISVLQRDGQLYAVEDFDREVGMLPFSQQERHVAALLEEIAPIAVGVEDPAARSTCELSSGFAGTRRPWFVMRFTTSTLGAIPEELRRKLLSGRFHEAQVGACPLHDASGFSGYNLAVLLFP